MIIASPPVFTSVKDALSEIRGYLRRQHHFSKFHRMTDAQLDAFILSHFDNVKTAAEFLYGD